jgi:hypothetical protein
LLDSTEPKVSRRRFHEPMVKSNVVRRQRPTREELERIFPAGQTFKFSGVVSKDGTVSESHPVTEGMTAEQRGFYRLWVNSIFAMSMLERVLREMGDVDRANQVATLSREQRADIMWSTYERMPDEDWQDMCADADTFAKRHAAAEPSTDVVHKNLDALEQPGAIRERCGVVRENLVCDRERGRRGLHRGYVESVDEPFFGVDQRNQRPEPLSLDLFPQGTPISHRLSMGEAYV